MLLEEFFQTTGISVVFIAKKCGVTQAYLSSVRHGNKNPSYDLACAIERATGGAVTEIELMKNRFQTKKIKKIGAYD